MQETGTVQERDELIESCMPLVRFIAAQYSSRQGMLSMEDMVSEGYVGLVQAANRFDTSRGARFSTYAGTRIRGAILDALRRAGPLSRDMAQDVEAYSDESAEMTASLGREPTTEEMARRLDMPESKVGELQRLRTLTVVSLDQRTDDFHEDFAQDTDSPEELLVSRMMRSAFRGYLARLAPREREVLHSTFWKNERHSNIAVRLGVSASRVSQIQKRALEHMRTMVAGEDEMQAA